MPAVDEPGIIRDETGVQRLLGYVVDVSGGDGRVRCTLVVDERHTNRHGRLHGGIAASLLDTAMGVTASLAVDAEGLRPVLTLSMTTNFVASGRLGDALVAVGRVTGGGRSILFVDGVLSRQDGEIVATATGTFKPIRADAR